MPVLLIFVTIMTVGIITYFVAKDAKVVDVGRIAFAIALFMTLFFIRDLIPMLR